MVVTIHAVDLLYKVFESHVDRLTPNQVCILLNALEQSYWHARSFNEAVELRAALASISFMAFPGKMDDLPHLLDQEAASATKIVRIAMGLYTGQPSSASFIDPWIQRSVFLPALYHKIRQISCNVS